MHTHTYTLLPTHFSSLPSLSLTIYLLHFEIRYPSTLIHMYIYHYMIAISCQGHSCSKTDEIIINLTKLPIFKYRQTETITPSGSLVQSQQSAMQNENITVLSLYPILSPSLSFPPSISLSLLLQHCHPNTNPVQM